MTSKAIAELLLLGLEAMLEPEAVFVVVVLAVVREAAAVVVMLFVAAPNAAVEIIVVEVKVEGVVVVVAAVITFAAGGHVGEGRGRSLAHISATHCSHGRAACKYAHKMSHLGEFHFCFRKFRLD